jgi:hypothetical protein
MSKPTVIIHNIETNEIIEREMNEEELEQYQSFADDCNKRQAEAEAEAQAKATAEGKLASLGLTTDDLRALGL